MQQLPDLSNTSQTALLCGIVIGAGLLLTRAGIAFHHRWAAVPHQYPAFWTSSQIVFLEQTRVLIGIALTATWVSLLAVSPALPKSSPFGLMEVVLTIILMLLTNAWILLVIPRDWKHTFIGKMSFGHALACIVVWWSILLGASMFAIAESATANADRPIYVIGTFA